MTPFPEQCCIKRAQAMAFDCSIQIVAFNRGPAMQAIRSVRMRPADASGPSGDRSFADARGGPKRFAFRAPAAESGARLVFETGLAAHLPSIESRRTAALRLRARRRADGRLRLGVRMPAPAGTPQPGDSGRHGRRRGSGFAAGFRDSTGACARRKIRTDASSAPRHAGA